MTEWPWGHGAPITSPGTAQILERIAEAISNGLSKTEAWEKVHAECGIPAGNFSRWCKMQDHIWSMAAKMRASRLLGPMARKVWRGRSTRRKPAKSGQFEAFEKKLLEEKCFQHSAFKLFLIKFVISRLGQILVEQFLKEHFDAGDQEEGQATADRFFVFDQARSLVHAEGDDGCRVRLPSAQEAVSRKQNLLL